MAELVLLLQLREDGHHTDQVSETGQPLKSDDTYRHSTPTRSQMYLFELLLNFDQCTHALYNVTLSWTMT